MHKNGKVDRVHGMVNSTIVLLKGGSPEMRHVFERPHSCFTAGCGRSFLKFWSRASSPQAFTEYALGKLTLAGLEPAIFGSEDQRLIH